MLQLHVAAARGTSRRLGLGASPPLRWALADVSLESSAKGRLRAIADRLRDLSKAVTAST